MGQPEAQQELCSYNVDLDPRGRTHHRLRKVAAAIDFTCARQEVARRYGNNGHVWVDPAVILKMMFLLFYDNLESERELMKLIAERMDYMWFLGYGLDQGIPDHSVLSKARARWGNEVFEKLFVQTIGACWEAGLIAGSKIHRDGSVIAAHASGDWVIPASPPLVAALKAAYGEQTAKLDESATESGKVNQSHVSTTDPDSELAKSHGQRSKPSYKVPRAVDDAHGVITAQTLTPGGVTEDTQLMGLVEQHQAHRACELQTVVADSQYGTAENFLACEDRGLVAHRADLKATQSRSGKGDQFFGEEPFGYDPRTDTYLCPAGQTLKRWGYRHEQAGWQYKTTGCAHGALREQCSASQQGRTLQRLERQVDLERLRMQAASRAARRDRRRRQYLMEGSFAEATNQHRFKQARWRGLWRQHIPGDLIAAGQNIRILLSRRHPRKHAVAMAFHLFVSARDGHTLFAAQTLIVSIK